MNRQALRSVTRQRPAEVERAANLVISEYILRRAFSTTTAHEKLRSDVWTPTLRPAGESSSRDAAKTDSAPSAAPRDEPRPMSPRQRSAAATSEINNMARSFPPAQQRPAGVLDVKVLPRGLRGPPMRRGPSRFGAPLGRENQQRGRPGGNSSRGGRSQGRGGRGGRFQGRGGDEGGMKPKPKFGKRKIRVEGDGKAAETEPDIPDEAEVAFEHLLDYGERTAFNPTLTRESLQDFLPSWGASTASSQTAAKEMRTAAVLENLSVLGTTDPVGATQILQGYQRRRKLAGAGLQFFADVRTRNWLDQYIRFKITGQLKGLERNIQAADGNDKATRRIYITLQRLLFELTDKPITPYADLSPASPSDLTALWEEASAALKDFSIQGAEESVRKVVVARALEGEHETPKFSEKGDVAGAARAWLLRAGTWEDESRGRFEGKLMGLLQRGAPAKANETRAG